MRKLSVSSVIQEGFAVGLKNVLSLIGASILWILTIWIPYINVGTTIAMCSIPVALSKGKVLSPTFIFGSQYRKQMGDFLILEGLSSLAIFFAFCFLIIPAYVLTYSWSQAVYLLLDKEMNATEALSQSNKLTYGHKWTLFGIDILIALIVILAFCIFGGIAYVISDVLGVFTALIICILILPFQMGCQAIIYKQLTTEVNVEKTNEAESVIETVLE